MDYDSNGYLFVPVADAGVSDDVFKLQGFKTESVKHYFSRIHVELFTDWSLEDSTSGLGKIISTFFV